MAAGPMPATEQPNLSYGPLPAETGDLYRPAASGPLPAIVVIHGGGWVTGSRKDRADLAERLAARGLVVFNIDYRLAGTGLPGTQWPAQLVDAQLAVRFLRAHAAEYGIDPARIGAAGDSAGGQLAVLLGVLKRSVPGDRAALYADQRPGVQAVLDEYGAVDLPGMGQTGVGLTEALFGTRTPDPAALRSALPILAVTPQSAPTYIIHGDADDVVPIRQSYQLRDALRAKRVPAEMVVFQGGHAYDRVPPGDVARMEDAGADWVASQLNRGRR